jgi:hypothetical protein
VVRPHRDIKPVTVTLNLNPVQPSDPCPSPTQPGPSRDTRVRWPESLAAAIDSNHGNVAVAQSTKSA